MTGTGLKKWRPTTREALFFPSSLVGFRPSGIAAAAILVILIELVFVARIASGLSSAENSWKIFCFKGRFSETAYAQYPSIFGRSA